jgi:hypothetical protein
MESILSSEKSRLRSYNDFNFAESTCAIPHTYPIRAQKSRAYFTIVTGLLQQVTRFSCNTQLPLFNQFVLQGKFDQTNSIIDPQLGDQVLTMGFYRADTEKEFFGNL